MPGAERPKLAERIRARRLVARTTGGKRFAGSDKISAAKRAELRGRIFTEPGLHRVVAMAPAGCCASTRPGLPRSLDPG